MPALPVYRRCGMYIPIVNVKATGENIKRLLIEAGMTVKDLQKIFGFATPQAIYKWIRGLALPTVDNLLILAKVFGVTVDDILVVNEVEIKVAN